MKEYIEKTEPSSASRCGMYRHRAPSRCRSQGYAIEGEELNVGDKFEVEGFGELEVQPNSVQGYDYEADGNGIIVMPERTVFTADNIDDYDF